MNDPLPDSTPSTPDVDKPELKPVLMRTPSHGRGQLKVGGTIGPGRPKNAWKQECAELANLGAKAARAKEILQNPDHPAWLGAWKFVTEQAYGKAEQRVEHAGDPENPQQMVVRIKREY